MLLKKFKEINNTYLKELWNNSILNLYCNHNTPEKKSYNSTFIIS